MFKKAAVLAVVVTMATVASAGAAGVSKSPHLRPANQQGAALMAEAQERSQTVRDLAAELDKSNVVAYVVTASVEPGAPESAIRFVGASKAQRFVLVQVSNGSTPDQRVELLAHELQHAVEVGRSPWVTDEATLGMLFTHIGWRDPAQQRGYNTTAANVIQRQVHNELVANVK